jgi:hypothetical protein
MRRRRKRELSWRIPSRVEFVLGPAVGLSSDYLPSEPTPAGVISRELLSFRCDKWFESFEMLHNLPRGDDLGMCFGVLSQQLIEPGLRFVDSGHPPRGTYSLPTSNTHLPEGNIVTPHSEQ